MTRGVREPSIGSGYVFFGDVFDLSIGKLCLTERDLERPARTQEGLRDEREHTHSYTYA